MSSNESLLPETKVLAIASHVVYGYVGNTMATFCMQALGCEVSAMHTVHFSNHTGYRQWKGTKVTAPEILDLWTGLKESRLIDFDVLLSGYAPSAEVVDAIGSIAKELKEQQQRRDGGDRLFWVMDPVMGDNGRLYVSESVVPAYKALLPYADLILPNQFEAELLSGIQITNLPSLISAISRLHATYKIPHIIVTSVRFPFTPTQTASQDRTLSIIGSTITAATCAPRLFHITVPDLDAFFSGTGDMFAALIVARLRQMCVADGLCGGNAPHNASDTVSKPANPTDSPGSSPGRTWLCPDGVPALETPLARAAELVCASLCAILAKTKDGMDRDEGLRAAIDGDGSAGGGEGPELYLRRTKAAEVRVVRFQSDLREPHVVYRAEGVEVEVEAETEAKNEVQVVGG